MTHLEKLLTLSLARIDAHRLLYKPPAGVGPRFLKYRRRCALRRLEGLTKLEIRQAGFGVLLLEMMLVCCCLLILAAMSFPNLIAVHAVENAMAARDRLETVSRAESTAAMCAATPGCTVPVTVNSLIPAPGTIPQRGYTFTFTQNPDGTWTYVAQPITPGFTGTQPFFVDTTGIVRCGTDGSAPTC
jgi:hypothetical protein